MLALERRNEILEKLQKEKRVIVSELSAYYAVSEETIRRDLEKFEKDGYAIKSYGGAIFNESTNIDLPFNLRKNTNIIGKQRIANLLTDLVNDGESLMLDSSSTAVFIAKALKDKKKNLTVVTNSIEIIIELFDASDWRVISTGGLAEEGSFALVGPKTDQMLGSYYVNKAIISCKGLSKNAVTDSSELHAQNKNTMLSRAAAKILAVDSSKFGTAAFAKICDFNEISMIITDKKPEQKWLKLFKEAKIECIF
ncbi:MAG: DeoR/GlpR family DNA-binding transcription regulator [Lachnospiraceae bacterium]|nr:DeoR/GlpR family DNA-binding transcription regulator [Lachnospiraceae bacterium]